MGYAIYHNYHIPVRFTLQLKCIKSREFEEGGN